jgi:hypothetical protein
MHDQSLLNELKKPLLHENELKKLQQLHFYFLNGVFEHDEIFFLLSYESDDDVF